MGVGGEVELGDRMVTLLGLGVCWKRGMGDEEEAEEKEWTGLGGSPWFGVRQEVELVVVMGPFVDPPPPSIDAVGT